VSFDRSTTISGDQIKTDPAQRSHFESPRVNSLVPDAVGGDNGEDYLAVSGGFGYLAKTYEWTSRAEYRDSDSEQKRNFDFGYHRDISSGVAQTLGMLYTHELTRDTGKMLDTVDARMSTGWRPLDSDWIVLQRLDLVFEKDAGDALERMTRKIIQNTHANYKPDMLNQYSFQYSSKYVLEALEGIDYSGYTDYTGLEYRRFLGKQWDVGVQAGSLRNWEADNMDYMAGLSVGYSPVKNTWISVGYNFIGFRDEDFANADYTDKGLYLKFRIKFDQESLRNLVKKF
jgi:hypothetical protein